jgi:voltage-gated potassium channel
MSSTTRVAIAVTLVGAVMIIGAVGYVVIEGWPLLDALYMTIITFTTVGFGEVHPLSRAGRSFTLVFLGLSVATVGYSITTVISFLFEGQFADTMRERRMRAVADRMRDHYIVCGCGDVGRAVVAELKRAATRFLVIDLNPERSQLFEDRSIPFVTGDASEEAVLREAHIARARGLIAALPDDAANVFVVLTARQMNPELTIVAKASNESVVRKLEKSGADRVITPYQIAGRRMASSLLRPTVVNFLDVFVEGAEIAMRIEELRVPGDSQLVGRTLREANIGQHTGAIVLGIVAPDGETRVNATTAMSISNVRVEEGDILIAMGSDEQLKSLSTFVSKDHHGRGGRRLRRPRRSP